MGNEIGFIRIANLEGTTKAFANAADLDQDGKVEGNELAVFNRLVGEAGLNQDQGLVVEREQAENRGAEATPKELAKQEDKMYKECFGFKAGSADLANFKNRVASCDSRVIAVFKQLKSAGDMEAIMRLNEQIANRPDMTNYIGNSAEYLSQLERYADDAEALLQQSDRAFIAGEVRGGTEAVIANNNANTAQIINNDNENTAIIMANDDANTAFQASLTLEVGEALAEKIDANTQAILDEVKNGNAQVIKAIRTAEGNIIHVVRTEGGETRAVITNAKNQIIGVTKEEGFITRLQEAENTAGLHRHIDTDGARTRRTVHNSARDLHEHLDENERNEHRRDFNPLMPNTWF